jgi:hypothetical protein
MTTTEIRNANIFLHSTSSCRRQLLFLKLRKAWTTGTDYGEPQNGRVGKLPLWETRQKRCRKFPLKLQRLEVDRCHTFLHTSL